MQLQHSPWNYFFFDTPLCTLNKRIKTLKIFLSYNKALFALYYQTCSVKLFHLTGKYSWNISWKERACFFCFLFFSCRGLLKFLYLSLIIDSQSHIFFISLAESWLGTKGILGSIFMQLPSWNLSQCTFSLYK